MKCFLILCLVFSIPALAQNAKGLYDPAANAEAGLASATLQAKKEGKHVLVQVGGNWCTWCYKFNSFVLLDAELKHLIDSNYVVYHLNYSKENQNLSLLKKLGNPERFGFPVLLVLDGNGRLLHTQDTSLLEKGNGYDKDKVKGVLINWSPEAIHSPNP